MMWPYKCGAAGNPESTAVGRGKAAGAAARHCPNAGLDGIPWDTRFSSDSHPCLVLPYLAIIIIIVVIILLGVLDSAEGNASS